MPTILNTFALGEFRMVFRERFVTEGLNQKFAVVQPPGIHRGFRLVTEGSANNTVRILPDPTLLDHVAVYQTDTGFSLTIRNTGGPIDVDLTSLVSGASDVTVVIAIQADYQIGSPTTATIKAYTLDPADELTGDPDEFEVVKLGTVVLPQSSAAPLPAANVTPEGFQGAWEAKTSGSRQWSQVIRNASFDASNDPAGGGDDRGIANWRINGDVLFTTDDLDPRTGKRAVGVTFPTAGSSGQLIQNLNIPVLADSYIRVQFWKKTTVDDLSGGVVSASLAFGDETGSETAAAAFVIDMSAVDGDYVEQGGVIKVPAGVHTLLRFELLAAATTGPAENIKLYIDDVRVWVEDMSEIAAEDRASDFAGDIWSSGLVVHDQALDQGAGLFEDAALIEYTDSTELLSLSKLDGSAKVNLAAKDGTFDGAVSATTTVSAANLDVTTAAGDAIDITNDGNGTSIDIDHNGTGVAIDILLSAAGSRGVVLAEGAVAQTTPMFTLTRNAASVSVNAHVIDIQNDGNGIGLNINNTGNGEAQRITTTASDDALVIVHNGASGAGVQVFPSTAGRGFATSGNSSLAGVFVSQDGTGRGVEIVQSGSGDGLNIICDSNVATQAIVVSETSKARTSTNPLVEIQSSTSSSGVTLKILHNTGTGTAFYLDKNSTSGDAIQVDCSGGTLMDLNQFGDAITLDIDRTGGGTATTIDVVTNQTGGTALIITATSMTGGDLFVMSGQTGTSFSMRRMGRMVLNTSTDVNTGAVCQFRQQLAGTAFTSSAMQVSVTRVANSAYRFYEFFSGAGADREWYVDGVGRIFSDSGGVTTPADYAEYIDVEADKSTYEAGDVMVFSGGEKLFDTTTTPNSSKIAGVYSTDPALLGNSTPGCSEYQCEITSGTLEASAWIMSEVDDNEDQYDKLIVSAGDHTANYATDSYVRVSKDGSAGVIAKVISSSYAAGPNETTVVTGMSWPVKLNSADGYDLHYGLDTRNVIPLGMLGQIPTKCITENGTISPGDLLVTSSTAGHAMKGTSPAVGTVLGKAMETLTDTGSGTDTATILVYVNIH